MRCIIIVRKKPAELKRVFCRCTGWREGLWWYRGTNCPVWLLLPVRLSYCASCSVLTHLLLKKRKTEFTIMFQDFRRAVVVYPPLRIVKKRFPFPPVLYRSNLWGYGTLKENPLFMPSERMTIRQLRFHVRKTLHRSFHGFYSTSSFDTQARYPGSSCRAARGAGA